MQGIVFTRREASGQALIEYSFYENKFAPGNLVVRKVFMAMLSSVKERLTQLEVEYNDVMLAGTLGKRAGDVLRLLGASKENLRENKQGVTVVSREFQAKLTDERYDFFYTLDDLSRLLHYKFLEENQTRVEFYFGQYLLLVTPLAEEKRFYQELANWQVPYKILQKSFD